MDVKLIGEITVSGKSNTPVGLKLDKGKSDPCSHVLTSWEPVGPALGKLLKGMGIVDGERVEIQIGLLPK